MTAMFWDEPVAEEFFEDDAPEVEDYYVSTDHDYEEDHEWYPTGACDSFEVHLDHNYVAINGETYNCAGLNASHVAAMEEEARRPLCEHGMNASLCSGPNHY